MLKLEDFRSDQLRSKKAMTVLRQLLKIDPALLSEKDKHKIGLGVLE